MKLLGPILLLATAAAATDLFSIPSCVQSCIDDAHISCSAVDVRCVCQASSGAKLTSIIVCARSQCDRNIDVKGFLGLFQVACSVAGAGLPASVISAAQSAATETITVTTGIGAEPTATTVTTTDASGQSYVLVVPVTVIGSGTGLRTSTLSATSTISAGAASSTTQTSTATQTDTVTTGSDDATALGTTTTGTASTTTTSGASDVSTGAAPFPGQAGKMQIGAAGGLAAMVAAMLLA